MSLKLIYILPIVIIILLGTAIGYKVEERNVLKSTVDSYETTAIEEYSLITDSDQLGSKLLTNLEDFYAIDDKTKSEVKLELIDSIIRNAKIIQDKNLEYHNTLKRNNLTFDNLKSKSRILTGKAKKIQASFINNTSSYYVNEIKASERQITSTYTFINLFETLRDFNIAIDHADKYPDVDNKKYKQSLPEISSLEKYTDKSFEFHEQNKIKELYPYSYSVLEKYRNYLSAYFEVIRDYINEDYESGNYKYARLSEAISDLVIDWDRYFKEGTDTDIELQRSILESWIKQMENIQELNNSNVGTYPSVDKLKFSKLSLLTCQTLWYKSGLFKEITSKYPESKTVDELLKELSQIAPKTSTLEKDFDKDTLKLNNTDDKITFICSDRETGKEYTTTFSK